ncbi:MAG TPA: glycine--tRNA ligase subunit beta [Patescibacteria group bacterium]|nr:glycine--tRNA ligase subunit beta [Patescibacteria group bacterium]
MAEFLLELFSEEIPARMQVKATEDLKDLIIKGLTDKGLTITKAEAHSTPRRIAVVVDGLPEQQPDTVVEKKGPRVDAQDQALQGFLKSINQPDFSKCVKEENQKGTFWFYRENVQGQPVGKVLTTVIEDALNKMAWPKSMRWKSSTRQWVRPLHSIVALFGGHPVNVSFALGGGEMPVSAGKSTQGHRFLSSGKIEVLGFGDYREKLKKAHVMLTREERKEVISKQSQELANKAGLKIREDEALFEEIVGLVEWPVPLVGEFEKEYLDVPQEVLISTMRGNQKYIALLDAGGKLSNKFIVVANMITEDGGKQVVAGNEKVLRARLSDAKFFWDQDRRQKLETRLPALEQITFHQKLGTVRDRVSRLHSLAQEIAELLGYDGKQAARAAELCKADLTSGVVYQFPEVQGTMGRYYALHDKEKPEVAQAIAEHYKPVGANDGCPTAPVSIAVALADKLDALVGFFAIDEKPTGSKDPFALRRAALGMIRIILENKLRISLSVLFRKSYQLYAGKIKGLRPEDEVTKDLTQFFTERLKVALKDQGVRHDLIDAVFAAKADDDLTRVVARVNAVQDFVRTEDGVNLLAGYKRATNILRIEEKKDGKTYSGRDVQENLLGEQQEKNLFAALGASGGQIKADLAKEDFTAVMSAMSGMRGAVDAFFEKILVNAPEQNLRANRLSMLAGIAGTMNEVADFSKLEG